MESAQGAASAGECTVDFKVGKTRRIENAADQRTPHRIRRAQERREQHAGEGGNAGEGHAGVDRSGDAARSALKSGRSELRANRTDGGQAGAEIRRGRKSESAPCF